tara:strand:+ start:6106 stop:6813 length:708 start_codon:yes stop_codon:yes gene_type:complete
MKKKFYSYFDKTINFNFITRYLHNRKYLITKKILCKHPRTQKINIIDIGCGSASMYEHLKDCNLNFNYIGIEPDKDLFDTATKNYGENDNFSILKDIIENNEDILENSHVIIAMDSLEHIPYNNRNELIKKISQLQNKVFLVNVPNEVGPILAIKNIGSFLMGYPRYKEYSFIESVYATFYRIDKMKPHIDAHKGFDWRTLEYSLRYNFKNKVKVFTIYKLVPKFLSPSIYFKCD